jgi:hypothetical protein
MMAENPLACAYFLPLLPLLLPLLLWRAGVAPEKLKRTASLSSLDEIIMGRDSDQQQQCFVFMIKVGHVMPSVCLSVCLSV